MSSSQLGPDTIIELRSPLLGSNLGWKGKYLFVARMGDIFLPVYLPFDKLRWEIDRPMTVMREMQLYAAGDWFKTVRGEQGFIPAINMISQLQREAMTFYHDVMTTTRRLANGERGVSRLVSEGPELTTWREVVPPGRDKE